MQSAAHMQRCSDAPPSSQPSLQRRPARWGKIVWCRRIASRRRLNQMIQSMATPPDLKAPAQSGAMSDHLVRVGRLKALQRERGWNESELARQCGRKPQQVYSWYANRRMIGERLARSLEEALQLPRYALDDRAAEPVSSAGHAADSPPAWGLSRGNLTLVQTAPREMPVIRWAQIQTMLDADNAPLKSKAPHLESYAVSSARAKFVVMPDDSVAPEFAQGDHVLCDPPSRHAPVTSCWCDFPATSTFCGCSGHARLTSSTPWP